jgi:hypothetical protein
MRCGFNWGRSIGKETVIALLSSLLFLSGIGCGNKDENASRVAPMTGQDTSAGKTIDVQGRKAGTDSLPSRFAVFIAPSSPSRSVPPSISVKSPPGQGAEVLGVQWFVNGTDASREQTLSADRFRRGDKINAVVKLRTAAGEENLSTAEVVVVNALPTVVGARIEPKAPTNGGTVRVIAEGDDPDGDPVTFKYKWYVNDLLISGDTDSMILKDVKKGSWVHVAVTSNDGFGDGAWMYSPRYQVVNAPPVVKNPPPTEVPPSRLLKHTIVAEDPDGDPLTYVLEKSPPGVLLEGSTLTWQVPSEFIGKNAEITVLVSDNDAGSTRVTFNLTVREK